MLTLCPDSDVSNAFLGLFDLSLAPTLLYYSYIPIIFIVLFFGLFILFKDRFSILSKILFLISSSFIFWNVNEIVQWTSIHNEIIFFSWQLVAVFQFLIFLFAWYFVEVFIKRTDIPFLQKIIFALSFLPVFFLLSTRFNISSYDFVNCEGFASYLWDYIYVFQLFSIFWIIYICVNKIFKVSGNYRKQIILLCLGVTFLLSLFPISNFYNEFTNLYDINLIGPLGIVLFIAFLSYMIVKFKAFNIKMLATQALVVALWFLVFAILFIRQVEHVRWVVVATLVLLAILGLQLVKSVKREVALREELEVANKNQQSLIGFITHQVKGFFTKSRNIFSMILEEDYGPISPDLKVAVKEGFESDTKGVDTVQEILKASNIKKGVISYNMSALDLKPLAKEIFESHKKEGESKGLQMIFDAKDDKYEVNGDAEQMKQALKNLVDNAVKYTLSGSVSVKLERVGGHIGPKADGRAGKIVFSVKDTGVGISKEDFANLFKEGGRGKDSVKVNVNSTGYGLYIVKNIVEAHGGRIWAESAGSGKGSTFFVELPIRK